MGWMVHDAIIVTSWSEAELRAAHAKARSLMPNISGIVAGIANLYLSFMIAPDGSKEGWEESDQGDRVRKEFLKWIDAQADPDDGSNRLEYAAVRFGEIKSSVVSNSYEDRALAQRVQGQIEEAEGR